LWKFIELIFIVTHFNDISRD